TDYALAAKSSSLRPGAYRAVPMLGAAEPTSLTIDVQGGFAQYRPLPTLPPQSYLVLQLQK
ncbi:MAG TPA: hypothetical protein VLG46_06890, partial [Anaerolineae bacterium]|nr:hypothetical protein [Anaerolineae bacterium]